MYHLAGLMGAKEEIFVSPVDNVIHAINLQHTEHVIYRAIGVKYKIIWFSEIEKKTDTSLIIEFII